MIAGIGIVDAAYQERVAYDQVIDSRQQLKYQLMSVVTKETNVFMYGSYLELERSENVNSIMSTITQQCFVYQLPRRESKCSNL